MKTLLHEITKILFTHNNNNGATAPWSNNMKRSNPPMPESTILDCKDDLFAELTVTGSVYVNGDEVTVHDLLEMADDDDKNNVIAMQLVDTIESKAALIEMLWALFLSEYDDEAIEKHLIDEGESL